MSRAHVVIGANYGDEGKGLMTDYLVNREKASIVVRFNGGAQAGHTVVTPDGKSHVFSHFGSGTFAGAQTFLSRYFVVSPMLFFKELAKLQELNVDFKKLIVDPNCYVTTPYDIMINQARERDERASHQGSCGVGFGETIERSQRSIQFNNRPIASTSKAMLITAQDIWDASYDKESAETLRFKLEMIRREWVPIRLQELKINYTAELKRQVMNADVFYKFREDCDVFGKLINLKDARCLINQKVVFEGAQGLGLDQVQGDVPNITRSFTGLDNVLKICAEAKIDSLEVYYATRAYLTRHGAGSMEHELKQKPYPRVVEKTNLTNEFQGKFRFGNLDVDKLKDRIRVDLRTAQLGDTPIQIVPKLAVTCVDQIDSVGRYYFNGKLKRVAQADFARSIAYDVGVSYFVESWGPTRLAVSGDRISI